MYGAQTQQKNEWALPTFENDVEMYGAQTDCYNFSEKISLRMM